MSLELKVNEVTNLPAITFNYEELKSELETRISSYLTKTYTEADIKEAKEDRAKLNNLVKAINTQKIAKKNEYMAEYNKFETQIKEIMAIIEKGSKAIDEQVKAFEDKQKNEKKFQIEEYFNEVMSNYNFISLNNVMDDKWLNSSTSMKTIREAIDNIKAKTDNDLEAIKQLCSKYETTLLSKYYDCRDLGTVILEKNRLEKIEQEQERIKQLQEQAKNKAVQAQNNVEAVQDSSYTTEQEKVSETYHRAFEVWGTREQIIALGNFMNENNIKFKKIEGVN